MLDRIKALMAAFQLSPSQFADQTTLPRPVVSHILSGRNKPSLEVVQKILAAYPDVAIDWLLNGRGPMLNSSPASEPASSPGDTPAEMPPSPTAPPPVPEPPASPAASKRPNASRPPRSAQAPSEAPEQPWEAPAPPVAPPAGPASQPVPQMPPLDVPQPTAFASLGPQAAAPTASAGLYPTPPAAVQQVVRPEKVVRRIMVFYSDGTFSDHRPLAPEDNPFLW